MIMGVYETERDAIDVARLRENYAIFIQPRAGSNPNPRAGSNPPAPQA